MNRLSSTWDRVFGKLRAKRMGKGRCGAGCRNHNRRSFHIEPLEERTLLSVTPLSDETLLNTYTGGSQRLYDSGDAVAACADGGYVATWTSDGQDGSGNGVYAQRLDAGGAPLGSEFLVNKTTALAQQRSSVAAAADGSYVIVWDSYGQDGIMAGIFGRRYDAQGQALGGEFQVNETSFGHQSNPAVACLDDGGFVVVWSGPGTGDLWGVFARRYDADGAAVGGEFRVNSSTGNMQRMAAVAALPECGFIVAWQSHGGQDGSGCGIFAQRFDADCVPVGGEFQANATTAGHQQYPAVGAAADGRFTIAWQSDGQDGSGSGVFAQRFDADGTPAGGEFQVNTYIYCDQECPAVAYNAGGGFAVSWSGKGPGDTYGVFIRAFDADGAALGDESLVNETTAQWQQYSAIASAGDRYAVAWSGKGAGDNDGVFFRRFGFPLSTSGIAEVSVAEDATATTIDLAAAFEYAGGGSQLTYQVTGVAGDSLFDAVSVAGDQLTLAYAADAFGSADVTVRATAPGGEFVETTFAVNVAAMNDAPAALPFDPIAVNEDPEQVTLHLGGVFRDVDDWFYGLRFEIMSNDNPALFTSARLSGSGDALVLDFVPESSGSANIVLRATDEEGLWAEATVPVMVAAVNDAPAAAAATAVLARQDAAPAVLDLSALFSDADDAVENLSYQIVDNDNPSLVAAQLQGAQLTLAYQPGQTGTAAIVVRASDALGHFDDGSYHTIDATVSATNLAPQITGLLDAPDPGIEGATLHLTATGVIDDTAVTSVAFWRDSDHNDVFDPAVDQLLGVDTSGVDGWAVSVSSAGFGTGGQRYFAQATDEDSVAGNIATATGLVGAVAVLDDGAAGYVESGDGWSDNAAGGYLGTARRHAAGSGENKASWTFDGLMAQPHEVYVTWQAVAGLASNAQFSVYDGQTLLGTFTVDQRVAPDDVDEDGAAWLRLGEFTIANGRVTVVLSDAADGPVVADAVRLVDPPPTIESLSVTATVTRPDDVTLTAVNVADSDGTVVEVAFYRDTNGNAVLNVGVDELLGTDTTSGDGWSITADTTTFSTGTQTYFARAKDNAGLYSTAVWAQGIVDGPAAWGPASVYEGNTYTLQLDPTDIAITEWTIDWGDGTQNDVVAGSTRSLTHVYADGPESWTIAVTGTDGVDTHYANTIGVSVLNVVPYLSVSGEATVSEGSLYTLNLSVDDPGDDDITGWTIDWGDGGAPEYFAGNPSSVTHYYADGPANYTIAATADDEDGSAWPTGGTAGALDYSFGTDGNTSTTISTGTGEDRSTAMTVDNNGRLVVVGSNGARDALLARYNADGSLDTSFGDDGQVVMDLGGYDQPSAVVIQADGKIVVGGLQIHMVDGVSVYDFLLARFHPNGTIDLSFGDGGKVLTNFGTRNTGRSLALQYDGKILLAGYANYGGGGYNFALARYTADGRPDPSFGDGGKVWTDIGGSTDYGRSVTVQSDNKILVAGQSYNGSNYDFALARYNTNGSLDTLFDGDGKVTTPFGAGDDVACSVAIHTDTIVVAGSSYNGSNNDVAVARYTDTGALDTNFDTDGKYTFPIGAGDDVANAVAVASNGDVLLAGYSYNGSNYDFAAARYDLSENGLDDGFASDGIQMISFGGSNDYGYALELDETNDLVFVAGYAYTSYYDDFAVACLDFNDGGLETGFSADGKVTTDFRGGAYALDVVVQADQKIVAAGYGRVGSTNDFILVRYNSDGSLDTGFSGDGIENTDVYSWDNAYGMTLQTDQKIVAVGIANANFGVARYDTDGTLDASFSDDGKIVQDIAGGTDYATDVAVQSDGCVVVAGYAYVGGTNDFAVVRFDEYGNLDASFDGDDAYNPGNGIVTTPIGAGADYASAIALQSDGKILVAGRTYNGANYDFAVVCYNPDGTLDDDFDGDDEPGNGVVTLDLAGGDDYIMDMIVLDDERILVAGYAMNSGNYDFALACFHPDGTLDTSFDGDGIVLTPVRSGYHDYGQSLALQSDGKILLTGYSNWPTYNYSIVRYNPNGLLDATFDGDGMLTTEFDYDLYYGYGIALQADDRIVVSGIGGYDFQTVRYLPGDVPHTVSVANVAPTLTVVGNQTVVADAPFTLTDIGTFTDPGFGETYSYTIDWGDGSDPDQWIATIDVAGEPGVATEGSFDGSHVYDAADVYTVTVTLDDGEEQDQETFYITARTSTLFTWDGGGADGYWTTAENWAGDAAPLPGDQLRFAGTVQTASENDFPDESVFESIEFAAAGFSLSGNAITLTDSITVNSAATNAEIYFDIALDGAIAVDVAADATLTIFGELYGGGSLTKTGLGTLILAGASTYTGGTTVSAGRLSYVAMDRDEHVLEGSTLYIALNASDFLIGALEEPLSFSLESDDIPLQELDFNQYSHTITWTPDTNWGGYTPTVCVTATNQAGDVSATQTIFIDVYDKNRSPAFTGSLGTLQATEGQAFSYDFSSDANNYYAMDPDAADAAKTPPGLPCSLTFTLEDVDLAMYNSGTGPTISAGGAFSWTPSEAHGGGTYHFKVRVTDEGGLSILSSAININVAEVDITPQIVGPSSITVDNRTAASFRYTVDDPEGYSGNFYLAGTYPGEVSVTTTTASSWTAILQWNPTYGTETGTRQFNLVLSGSLEVVKPITLYVNEGNGTVPSGPIIWPNQVPWCIPWNDIAQSITLNFASSNPESTETTTYTVLDSPAGLPAPSINQNGVLTWNIPANPPTGIYSLTIGVSDDGTPSYSSQMQWWGQIVKDTTHFIANPDFTYTLESGVYKTRVSSNDTCSSFTEPIIDTMPMQGTISDFYWGDYLGSYYWTCDYTPNQGFQGVDSFTYSYPAEYLGGDLMFGASNTATVYVAVEPVSVALVVQGQYDTANDPEAVLPINSGWEEEGIRGVTRVLDKDNNGIVEDVGDDYHLRTGSVTLTNDFPCDVTGYWTLSIPYYADGQWKDDLGNSVRAYRRVGDEWEELFACQQIPVTIASGQSLTVPLALEGFYQPPGSLTAVFHVVRLHDDNLQGGFGTQNEQFRVYDAVGLKGAEVNLTIYDGPAPPENNAMPETYEDTLPMVVAMNRDYDEGRMGEGGVPLPDCTPGVSTLPNAAGDDELRSAAVALPNFAHALWKLNIPGELRVWRWDAALQTWWLVESGVEYSAAVSGATFNLLVEGMQPSATPDNFIVLTCRQTDAEGNPLGLPVSDSVKVEVVAIDLEIAQISELDEETQPAFVPVNDDYDEENKYPNGKQEPVMDNELLHGYPVSIPRGILIGEDDLVQAKLTIDGPNGQTGKYWIEVTGEPQYAQYVLVWKSTGVQVPRSRETALPVTLDANAVDLLIEGLAAYYDSQHPIRLIAHFEPDGDYAKAGVEPDVTDEAIVAVVKTDLDIDSDNNNGFNTPERTVYEEEIEDRAGDAKYPGKIIAVNNNDDDADGIPDFADGFNLFGGTSNQTAGEDFTPLVIELPAPIDLETATLRLTYDDSDPAGVTRTGAGTAADPYVYTAAAGHLRIWTKDGSAVRNESGVHAATHGDYVPSATYDDLSALGFTGGTRTVTLYVEGIDASELVADQRIKIEVDPDGAAGPQGFKLIDAVRTTVVKGTLTGYRPQTETYGHPFARTAVPENLEETPGVGIRLNGDNDDRDAMRDFMVNDRHIAGENDLIEVVLEKSPLDASEKLQYRLKCNNDNLRAWTTRDKAAQFHLDGKHYLTGGQTMHIWIEWVESDLSQTADLELQVWDGAHNQMLFVLDKLHFYPFHSIVIVLGGETQNPGDPVAPENQGNYGMFEQIAIPEYRNGYDVWMYNEDAVDWFDGEGAVYNEVVRAIQERGITQVAIMGYSHGGGATYQLAERLYRNTVPGDLTDITNPFTIPYTAYIDAVTSYTAAAENRRPLLTQFHCNQYQTNLPLRGGPASGDDDIDRTYLGVVHGTIDDNAIVIELVRLRFTQHITR